MYVRRNLARAPTLFECRVTPADCEKLAVSVFLCNHPPKGRLRDLHQNFMNHRACNVGQAEVPTGVTERQRFVVESQKVKDGGVEVMDMNLLLRDRTSVIIARPVRRSRAHSRTRHPRGKRFGMMFPAFCVFRRVKGGSPKLRCPDDKGLVEKSP